MHRNERFAAVLLQAYVFTVSFCSAAAASSEPNAVDLVRAVRESENWLGRIDSLQLRIEGKWSHPPESIAVRRAKLKKQSPDEEPDPEHDWSLKPSYPDLLEYAIDFKSKRLRHVEEAPGREYFLKIWDRKQAEQLEEKGVTVIAVQTSQVDKNTLNEWVKKNNIPFPLGMIQDDEEKTRFNWGVKSLPWLILTDRSHVIRAEGFGFDNLDNIIEEMNNVLQ